MSTTIPQNQSVAEGKLILTNDENITGGSGTASGTYYYDIFGERRYGLLTGNDLRSSNNSITYQVFRAPVSPHITLRQNNIEVTSIMVSQTANVISSVEIISTHPITVSRAILPIQHGSLLGGGSILYNNNSQSFNYSLGQPRVESDGNYHYWLSIIPTRDNPSNTDPIKLGDISVRSRISQNGIRPREWVVVDDTPTGIEIVKTLLRTNSTPTIINLGESIGTSSYVINSLPDIDNAIPGAVYRGTSYNVPPSVYYSMINIGGGSISPVGIVGTSFKLFVAVPYGLTNESYVLTNESYVPTDTLNFIESDDRYYYTQNEIDNTFGIINKSISVIQSGIYNYLLTGNSDEDLDFLGEIRNFGFNTISTTGSSTTLNSDFVVGNEVNCTVSKNGNDITLEVPSRILGYTPKLITDPYYLDLISPLPVSFDVMVNLVSPRKINQFPGLGILSSAITTSVLLENEPIAGTSGITPDPSNIYYEDSVSGVFKYIRNIETYKYLANTLLEGTGYTHKTATWTKTVMASGDLAQYKLTRNTKYSLPENTSWVPCLKAPDNVSDPYPEAVNMLPLNSDDTVFVGYYVQDTSTSSPINMIEVDSLPLIGKSGYTYKIGIYKYVMTLQTGVIGGYTCYTSYPQWINSDDKEDLYSSSGIDSNGYYWATQVSTGQYNYPAQNKTPVYTSHPPANSSNYKTSHYIWNSSPYNVAPFPNYYPIDVTSLPRTRDQVSVLSSTIPTVYRLHHSTATNDYEYYWLTSNSPLHVCKVSPIYSVVAVSSPPPIFNSIITYSKGDKVFKDSNKDEVWESLIDGNLGITPGTNSLFWRLVGDVFSTDSLGYRYYEVSGIPSSASFTVSIVTIPIATPTSSEYVKVFRAGSGKYTYYRKGPNFLVSNPTPDSNNIKDYGLYKSDVTDPSNPVNTVAIRRFFTRTIDGEISYFQLNSFAPELLIPNCFSDSNLESKLLGSDYPGNIVLKGDSSESGFGKSTEMGLGGVYFVDFDEYILKYQSFSERIDLKQKRITKGLVSNFETINSTGLPSNPSEYKLYLGENEQNIIEVSIGPDITEVRGMIGVFGLTSVLGPASNRAGDEPRITVSGLYSSDSYSLTSPRLDGGNTENFIAEFPRNEGDFAITRNYQFSYSEDSLDSLVTLRIIQAAEPGEVRLGTRKLYFLGNGLLNSTSNFGFLTFSSNIRRNNNILSIDNIEVLSDTGEDLIDRDPNTGSYLEATSLSPTFVNYKAFLKLKPNTKSYNLEGFRIKIGKRNGNTITDRTLDDGTAEFWKYTDSGWVLLGSDYVPTYTEPYFQTLPAETNLGGVVCVCNSLRGWQGSYSVSLFRPGTTNFDNPVELEWRSTQNLQDIINDFNLNSNPYNPPITPNDIMGGIITNISTLPDIRTIKTAGLIYQIGTTYHYTYSDFITSDYTYGTLDLPVALGTGMEGQQKYHIKIVQSEYDTSGNVSITPLTNTFFTYAGNYDLLDTGWELYNTSGAMINNINIGETCFVRAVYSDVQNPSLVPYLETSYSFSDSASDIIIKANINLKVRYNFSSVPIDNVYKIIENTYTLYAMRKVSSGNSGMDNGGDSQTEGGIIIPQTLPYHLPFQL